MPISRSNGRYLITKRGDYAEAFQVAEWMIANPGQTNRYYATAHILLGYIAEAGNRLDQAMQEFDHAVLLDPAFPNPHTMRAGVYKQRGEVGAAAEEDREAIRLDRENAYAAPHTNLGVILDDDKDYTDAIIEERKAIRIDPLDPDAHKDLGHILCETGQRTKGLLELRQAVALDPRDSGARFALANWLVEKPGSPEDAEEGMDEARWSIVLAPKSTQAYDLLAHVLNEHGKTAEAIAVCKEGLHMVPEDRTLRELLRSLTRSGKQP